MKEYCDWCGDYLIVEGAVYVEGDTVCSDCYQDHYDHYDRWDLDDDLRDES